MDDLPEHDGHLTNETRDRKSTRLNSSHSQISYAVFCLKKKKKPDEGMSKIAEATGGGYLELMSAGSSLGAFDRVADELHHQYTLGIAPQKLDRKLHDLTVKVTKPGFTVRARKRYLEPKS